MSSAAGTSVPHHTKRSRFALFLIASEILLWLAAVLGLSAWTITVLSGRLGARSELARFADARAARFAVSNPNQHLWSPERIHAWRDSLSRHDSAPMGVLRIRRLGIEAPVLEGTDDWALNRGVGHVADTASPGGRGNCALAGHRDGFFRALKDVQRGETIELETAQGLRVYRVERTWIVAPDDVSVLDQTPTNALTLVTCYPFYFIGSAPQRFIVRAVDVSGN